MKKFIVEMECVVKKIMCCECETEEDARTNPLAHAIDAIDDGIVDWEVLSVKEDN